MGGDGIFNPLSSGHAVLCNAYIPEIDLSGAELAYANLSGAFLDSADLSGAFLTDANLSDAELSGAILIGAHLDRANLSGAELGGANLTDATLGNAVLTDAWLYGAILSNTMLIEADLSRAVLGDVDLRSSALSSINLSHADLGRADLRGAWLLRANLSGANLWGANLSEASLTGTNLSEAVLREANLIGASLTGTNLSAADLSDTDLVNAQIEDTIIDGARLSGADLSGSTYEAASAPASGFLTGIEGLTLVRFSSGHESGLILLRSALQEAGLRPLERQATYAIERGRTHYMITEPAGLGQWLGGLLRLVSFEWTTGYGLHPPRALVVLLLIMAGMTIIYAVPVRMNLNPADTQPLHREDDVAGGIYRIWPSERIVQKSDGLREAGMPRIERLSAKGPSVIAYAFYFSLLCAFHIGWRDLNVGSWLGRLQKHEYTLRARGWVRVVSGVQSLISVYLLAIWVLTYFGRPFQ